MAGTTAEPNPSPDNADRSAPQLTADYRPNPVDPNATVSLGVGSTPPAEAGLPATYRPAQVRGHTRISGPLVGGLGQVWKARDDSLGREVALKEIRPDRQNSTAYARFLREARVTGQLQHPGIAPVYELIQTGDSLYYTMRFIEGRTLLDAVKAYHDSRQRGSASPEEFRKLISAFVPICQAVAFAHSRGIIHRDLKGANIALGEYGEVIVLDWGIAKIQRQDEDELPIAIDPESDDADMLQTQPGATIGTPAYMAPEQARGEIDQIDARTDVYGLGAVLYEILTGRPPFSGSASKVISKVEHEAPLQPRSINRQVPPPLQAICLKCLSKQPEDRYPGARELATDVERWLADEPVSCLREPWTRRVSRWARKRRTLVISLATLLVTAIIGLTVGLLLVGREQRRTAEERDAKALALEEVERQRDQARLAKNKTREALDSISSRVVDTMLARQSRLTDEQKTFLRRVALLYRELAADPDLTPEGRLGSMQAYRRMATMRIRLGEFLDGKDAYDRAVAIGEQLVAEFPDRADFRYELAQTLLISSERSFSDLREQPRDLNQLRKCLALSERLAAEDKVSTKYLTLLAQCHMAWASELRDRKQVDEAQKAYLRSIEVALNLVDVADRDPDAHHVALKCFFNYSLFLRSMKKYTEAEQYVQLGLVNGEKLRMVLADDEEYARDMAVGYLSHGMLLRNLGQTGAAIKSFDVALTRIRELVAEYPAVPQYRRDLSNCHEERASLFAELKRSRDEQTERTHAAEIMEALTKQFSNAPAFQEDLEECQIRLASLYKRLSRYDLAEKAFATVVALRRKAAGEKPGVPKHQLDRCLASIDLADVHIRQGQAGKAIAIYREVDETLRSLIAAHPNDSKLVSGLAQARIAEASLLRHAGQLPRARELVEQARTDLVGLSRQFPGEAEYREQLVGAYNLIGIIAHLSNHLDDAEQAYQASAAQAEGLAKDFPDESSYKYLTATAVNNLSVLHKEMNHPDEAEKYARKTVDIWRERVARSPDSPTYWQHLASALNNTGAIYQETGRHEETEAVWRESMKWREKLIATCPDVPEFRQDHALSYANLANVLMSTKRLREAEELQRKALALREKLVEDYPDQPDFVQDVARTWHNLGITLQKDKRNKEAEEAWRKGLKVYLGLVEGSPNVPQYRHELGTAWSNVGFILMETDRHAEAEEPFRKALEIQRGLVKQFPRVPDLRRMLASTLTNLAIVTQHKKDYPAALTLFEEAATLEKALLVENPRNPVYRDSWVSHFRQIADLYFDMGEYDKAVKLLEEGVKLDYLSGEHQYKYASLLAHGISQNEKDEKLPAEMRKKFRESHASLAIQWLAEAEKEGFHDAARLEKNKSFDSIRQSADFKSLADRWKGLPVAEKK